MINKMKMPTLSQFEQVARDNGYEVFTPEEIASYVKEGIMKSRSNELSELEKENFVSDMMYLQKAIVLDNGTPVTRYYRKEQVKWEVAEDGTILKGIEGVYLDTPENRRLNRVGQPFVPSAEILKAIISDDDDSIMKAMQTGRYADTPENRRLHRVGQPYKKREGKGGMAAEEGGAGKKGDSSSGSGEKHVF